MRASGNGPMGAMLMIAPLVVVPVLAVIGIPQFAPVVASPGSDTELASSDSIDSLERDSVRLGHSARHSADDLFAPPGEGDESEFDEEFDERDGRQDSFDDLESEAFESDTFAGRPGRRRPAARNRRTGPSQAQPRRSAASNDPLSGWEVDPQAEAEEEFAGASEITDSELAEFGALEAAPEPRRPARHISTSRNRGRVPARTVSNGGFDEEMSEDASVDPVDTNAGAFEEFDRGQSRADAADADDSLLADASANPIRRGAERPTKFQPLLDRPSRQPRSRAEAADFEETPRRRAASLPESSVRAQSTDASADEGPESDAPLFEPAPPAKRQVVASSPAQPQIVADLTWRAATARLKQLGIRKHYFTYVEDRDTFLFCCALTPSDEPGVTQKFEAEADEPLLAVRDVLQQISDWQAGK